MNRTLFQGLTVIRIEEMSIKTTWIKRGRYLERWLGRVSEKDVFSSAKERKIWQVQDGNGKYIVLIDLKDCHALPPIKTLRHAAEIHPKELAHFVLFGGPRLYAMVGGMVSRFTGYQIVFVDTQSEAFQLADSLDESWAVDEGVR